MTDSVRAEAPVAAFRIGAALSTRRDGVAAVDAALDQALPPLGGVAPDLALLFVSPQHEDELDAILERVGERTDGALVLGCSAGGVIGGSSEVEDAPAVSVWVASLPRVGITPLRVTFEREELHGVFTGIEELPDASERPVLLVLADPFSFPADLLLGHLNERAAGMPVVGGMASGGIERGRNRLFFNGAILRDGAVGAILTGLDAAIVVSQGCRPVGETFAVTRAEKNVIFELGGQPAMRRVEELYEASSERDQLLMRRGLHVGQAISELKPELRRGDFLVRNVVGVDEASGAIAINDMVEVGQTLQFQVRDAESAREDLRALLEASAARVGGPVAGALLFTCNGRGQALFGEPDHDISALQRVYGKVPVAGFFAAGELGPVNRRNCLHGFTASLLLLRGAVEG